MLGPIRQGKAELDLAAMLDILRDPKKLQASLAEFQAMRDEANAAREAANKAKADAEALASEAAKLDADSRQRANAAKAAMDKVVEAQRQITTAKVALDDEINVWTARRAAEDAEAAARKAELAVMEAALTAAQRQVADEQAAIGQLRIEATSARDEATALRDDYRRKLAALQAAEK